MTFWIQCVLPRRASSGRRGRAGRQLRLELLPKEPRVGTIIQRLALTRETLSFSLTESQVRGMGFPICIAAAAQLVARRGGFIQSGRYAWMVPAGREVDILLEVDG